MKKSPAKQFQATPAQVCKVDEALGLVFGWAIVSHEAGEPYFDLQGDHIPEETMLKSAADFFSAERVSTEMHALDADGDPIQDGQVVFGFPLTAEIAKALDIETPRTGLLVALRPSPAVFEKFRSGEFTGFSIGGLRGRDEEVE